MIPGSGYRGDFAVCLRTLYFFHVRPFFEATCVCLSAPPPTRRQRYVPLSDISEAREAYSFPLQTKGAPKVATGAANVGLTARLPRICVCLRVGHTLCRRPFSGRDDLQGVGTHSTMTFLRENRSKTVPSRGCFHRVTTLRWLRDMPLCYPIGTNQPHRSPTTCVGGSPGMGVTFASMSSVEPRCRLDRPATFNTRLRYTPSPPRLNHQQLCPVHVEVSTTNRLDVGISPESRSFLRRQSQAGQPQPRRVSESLSNQAWRWPNLAPNTRRRRTRERKGRTWERN